ncbi:MAG TPA: PAS domain S-box protein [Blastocatellia bacterium]|nr:PAS domain S-box protein [Blastocatellia bacterium]
MIQMIQKPREGHKKIQAARGGEAWFRAIFENAAIGIARVAPDGRWLDVNQRLCDIVGYTREELMTKTFSDITHPDDLESDWNQARRLLAGEIENYSMEKRYYRKDGSIVWVSLTVSVTRKADGSPDYFVSVVEDISARKQAEEKLREREERLSLASWISRLGVFEWDEQADRAVWENERMYEIFGHTRADGALGKARLIERYVHPDDAATFEQALADGMKSGRPFHAFFRIRRKDGALRWLELAGNFELARDGAPMRMIGVLADITERKRAEAREREQLAQAQAARAAAEAANRSKDEFLAMVSHELRSPLNAILGYTRMLRSGLVDRDAINNVTAIVDRNAKAQLQIIEDLLDSACIITGKLRIETCPVNLALVLEAALDTVRAAAEAKGVMLVADFGPGPEEVAGDSARLQQVVWNLLSNGIKFTPEGGRVELRMESDANHISIRVSDTGKGIEPDFLPFIFDPFRQADSSSTRRYGGLGLGLSLVKNLVESHGGTITAASEGAGRGATFTVTLPRRQPDFIEPPAIAAPPREARTEDSIQVDQELSLEGMSVLVVDDQEDARELLNQALSQYGAKVTTASSGVEALAFLSNPPEGKRPDALILDIVMPDEDGYTVLKKVRALEASQGVSADRIPAIALTVYGRGVDRLRALQAGFQMHVAKPVAPAELAVIIASLATRRAWERGREK